MEKSRFASRPFTSRGHVFSQVSLLFRLDHNTRVMQLEAFMECIIPGRWSACFSDEKMHVFCISSEIFVMAFLVSFRISRTRESIEFPKG